MFRDVTKLTALDISNNRFTEIDKGAFARLHHLRYLNISNCADLQVKNDSHTIHTRSLIA